MLKVGDKVTIKKKFSNCNWYFDDIFTIYKLESGAGASSELEDNLYAYLTPNLWGPLERDCKFYIGNLQLVDKILMFEKFYDQEI